jgi:hypothetical protein
MEKDNLKNEKQCAIHDVMCSVSYNEKQNHYTKILNTLKKNKVMTKICDNGIYMRFGGKVEDNEYFSLKWYKISEF